MRGYHPTFFGGNGANSGDGEGIGFAVGLIGKLELVLSEWHQTPEYILENWTDEQFEAFWRARNRRIRETDRLLRPKSEGLDSPESRQVSDVDIFAKMGIGRA